MDNVKTISAVVEGGKVVLEFPELLDGTEVVLQVLTTGGVEVNPVITDFETEKSDTNQDPQDTQEDPEYSDATSFKDLNLDDNLIRAVEEKGYIYPSPIQEQSIPLVLEGRDLLATAQTGSGKTAAFSLPMIQRISKKPRGVIRGLVLAPTRELAIQIDTNISAYSKYSKIKHTKIYGGVSQNPQVKAVQRGVDILVATPGRLLDLISQGHISLENIEIFVLDEADRMLDMGFIRDINKIMEMIPKSSQILLFSATMPKEIADLSRRFLKNPSKVSVDPPSSTVDTIDSYVFFVEKKEKFKLLLHLLKEEGNDKTLVFTRTKHLANKVARMLTKEGIDASAIHGNKSQSAREKALAQFRNGEISVLVATDIAARGIDVLDITHVINYDMSNEPETYVHRIGRTARAGKSGVAYNFCEEKERPYLRDIERLIGQHLIRRQDHPHTSHLADPQMTDLNPKKTARKGSKSSKRRRKIKH